jgi:hypothetical protein
VNNRFQQNLLFHKRNVRRYASEQKRVEREAKLAEPKALGQLLAERKSTVAPWLRGRGAVQVLESNVDPSLETARFQPSSLPLDDPP